MISSIMESQARSLEMKIRKVKQEIADLGELRPSTLSRQYNVCVNPDCRCKATPPQKHGPDYQISFTRHGKSKTQFVRKEDLPEVKKQLRNYKRLRELADTWIGLGMELSRLKTDQDREHNRAKKVQPKLRFSEENRT